MLKDIITADQLSLVISQAAAPAFLLGAIASFLSVLVTHMSRIVDRSRIINAIPDSDPKKAELKGHLPELRLARDPRDPGDLLGGRKWNHDLPAHDRWLCGCVYWCPARAVRRYPLHAGAGPVYGFTDFFCARSQSRLEPKRSGLRSDPSLNGRAR